LSSSAAEELKAIERRRLRALVDGEIEVAKQLHADDFQLITPLGFALSKDQYLGAIASGQLRYLVWEPEDIAVRMHADSAVLRYKAKLENVWEGRPNPLHRYWHTDAYERRSGHWQVVWSQATEIK
jgi:hypothetical protein